MYLLYTDIQNKIGYEFKNVGLLEQALVRKSFSEENGGEHNEVLEFIGDKALGIVVAKILSDRFGEIVNYGENSRFHSSFTEGQLSSMTGDLIDGEMLAYCIEKLGFHNYLKMSRGDYKNNVDQEISVKEDLFEAIIGAVTLDSYWNITIIENVVKRMIDFEYFFNNRISNNYIAIIQHWSQRTYNELPKYTYSNNNNVFICELCLQGLYEQFIGYGKSKKEATFYAARCAYDFLKENNLLSIRKRVISEFNIDTAINKLQELYQKRYISEPIYKYKEEYDINGNSIWIYSCEILSLRMQFYSESSSKRESKKQAAYQALEYCLRNNIF